MAARAYPYELWPRVSRAEVAAIRRAGRAFAPLAVERARVAVASVLGSEVRSAPAPLERCAAGEMLRTLGDPIVAIVLDPPDGSIAGRIAIELEARLALVVVDRALGGSGGQTVPTSLLPLTDVERGVVAYVAARGLEAYDPASWTVAGVVTSRAALAGALGDGGASVWSARVAMGQDRGVLRAWLPDRALDALGTKSFPSLGPLLMTLPIDVVVDAGWGTLSRAELATLRVGDVVVLDETWLVRGDHAFAGRARAQLEGGRRLTLRCGVSERSLVIESVDVDMSAPAEEGKKMDEGDTQKDVLDRAGDVPIDVAIEIARIAMPLSEVASLRPGEVLATGRALRDRVVLRAGGRAIAEGELVEVEGEIGVRVLALRA